MTTWKNIPPRFKHKINGTARSATRTVKTDAQRELDKAKREEHERALETRLIQAGIVHMKQVELLKAWQLGYVWDFVIMVNGEAVAAVEVNGGIWQTGGHNTGTGLTRDYEKNNHLLALRHIPTLPVAPEHIADGRAIGWIKAYLGERA